MFIWHKFTCTVEIILHIDYYSILSCVLNTHPYTASVNLIKSHNLSKAKYINIFFRNYYLKTFNKNIYIIKLCHNSIWSVYFPNQVCRLLCRLIVQAWLEAKYFEGGLGIRHFYKQFVGAQICSKTLTSTATLFKIKLFFHYLGL